MEESKRIDDYLSGRLGTEAKQDFEKELSQDPELRKQVELQRDMDFLLRHQTDRAELKEQLNKAGSDFFAEASSSQPTARIRWIGWAAAAAAAVLLFMLWPVFVQPDLYQQYAEFPPLALSEKSTTTTDWAATEQVFNTGDYAEAALQLESYLEAFPNDQQARLYLGIAKMETGELEAARRLFVEVSEAAPALSDYADWYRALSFLKGSAPERARPALEGITQESPFYEDAQAILRQLR